MLREALVTAALVGALLASAPTAPALSDAICAGVEAAEDGVQNDADSGADAPDARALAFRVPVDGYYWGWLSPVARGDGDRDDWYSFEVPEGTELFMTNVTSNYTAVYLQTFTLTLYPPDGGATRFTYSDGPTISIPAPAPGVYDIHVTATVLEDIGGCEPAGAAAPDLPDVEVVQNHGIYVGCHPFCIASTATLG